MYKTLEIITEVDNIAYNKKDRSNIMKYLKTNYPIGCLIGVNLPSDKIEVRILDWSYIKSNNRYIIGGRAIGNNNYEYIIKPVKQIGE